MFRHVLYANGQTYDIFGTIWNIQARPMRPDHPGIHQCVQALQRMAFTPHIEEFMLDLDSDEPNLLVQLDIWLAHYGSAVVYSASSVEDSSLTTESFDVSEGDHGMRDDQSYDDVIEETYHSLNRADAVINGDVVANFMNLRYGIPPTRYEETMEDDDVIEV